MPLQKDINFKIEYKAYSYRFKFCCDNDSYYKINFDINKKNALKCNANPYFLKDKLDTICQLLRTSLTEDDIINLDMTYIMDKGYDYHFCQFSKPDSSYVLNEKGLDYTEFKIKVAEFFNKILLSSDHVWNLDNQENKSAKYITPINN